MRSGFGLRWPANSVLTVSTRTAVRQLRCVGSVKAIVPRRQRLQSFREANPNAGSPKVQNIRKSNSAATQEQPEVAGRNKPAVRSKMNQFHTPDSTSRSSRCRFAPAASNPAEKGDASHRVSQNDMPPLPGCWRGRTVGPSVDVEFQSPSRKPLFRRRSAHH